LAPPVPFFDAEAVARATPMPALVAALRAAFAGERHHAPARLSADLSGTRSLLVMPGWRDDGGIGVKIVDVERAVSPAIRSTYMLIDGGSGRPCALFDGTELTRRRTAAVSVLAATRLARPDARHLLILGTGALVAPLIEAYASAYALDTVAIWGRDRRKAQAAAATARDAGHPARAVDDIDAALAGADIVSAATLATSPLIAGARLHPGMHIDLIGAFRPDMCEADPEAFARARVFVDTRHGAIEEAGDLIQAIAAGAIATTDIAADLAALCSGAHAGRGDDGQAITLFKSVGTGIADLAAAELVLSR